MSKVVEKVQFRSEFARHHAEEPALRPFLLKTVEVFVIDRDGEPVMLRRRRGERVQRQATRRFFFEVGRLGRRWCFFEWTASGAMIDRQIVTTKRAALALYEQEPDAVRYLDLP